MGRRKTNQLDIDISNAIQAGMSYGRYMALKKNAAPKKKAEKKPLEVEEERKCLCCGKSMFGVHGSAKYCDAICREKYRQEQSRRPLHKKACPICGKEFMGMKHEKFCSKFCAKIAHNKRVKEYQARKARRAEDGK